MLETEPRRRTFTLKDLLAATTVIGLLLAVLVPLVNQGRARARRNVCINNLKLIGLGLQNHSDVFLRLPAVAGNCFYPGATNVWDTAPGATFAPNSAPPNGYQQVPTKAAGYSWIVKILPYLEETVLYNAISVASDKFQFEAFSTIGPSGAPFGVKASGGAQHFATIQLDELHCPDRASDWVSTASSGTARPPVSIPAYAGLFNAAARPPSGVALTNYVALSASHLACMGLAQNDPATDAAEPPNGVIVPTGNMKLKMVIDGLSKTWIVCETKEPAVNSWYDGTVCWTVGANPNASNQPTRSSSAIGMDGSTNTNGYWIFPQGTTSAGSLNYGPGANKKILFAPNGTTPAQTQPVSWGPSSDHPGGIVMHLACDGAVHAIASDIDPTLYINLITRAGGEPVTIPDAN